MIVLVYVDDLVIADNDLFALQKFKAYLSRCFLMKDLEILKFFLGLVVACTTEGLFLYQSKYALDVISNVDLLGSKPTTTPL